MLFVVVVPLTGFAMSTVTAAHMEAAVHTPPAQLVNSESAGFVHMPLVHRLSVHSLPSLHSALVTQLTHSFAPPAPTTQLGVALAQPGSMPAPASTHTSQVGPEPPPTRSQKGAAAMQPASVMVSVGSVSAQVTQVSLGAPEHTNVLAHAPGSPAVTDVFTHALAVQASSVQSTLSSQWPAVVHSTH